MFFFNCLRKWRTELLGINCFFYKEDLFLNKYLLIIFLYLISLSIRILRLIADPVLTRDAITYLDIIYIWKETNSYSKAISNHPIVPPLPLYLIKLFSDMGYPISITARFLSIIFSSFIPIIWFLIVEKIFHKRMISIITFLLLAINPNLVSCSIQPLRENPYMFLLGLSVLYFVKGIINVSCFYYCITGLYLGLALFCRYETLECLFIFPLLTFILLRTNKYSINKILILCGILLFSFTFSCVVLFYLC